MGAGMRFPADPGGGPDRGDARRDRGVHRDVGARLDDELRPARVSWRSADDVILPYTRLWPVEVRRTGDARGPRTISLLIVNVLMDNRAADRLTEIITANDPDLVLAVETDDWWCRQLERALGQLPVPGGAPAPQYLRHAAAVPPRAGRSRGAVSPEARHTFDPHARTPALRRHRHAVRSASGATGPGRGRHVAAARCGAGPGRPEIAKETGSAIVAGDLNDVAWSHTSRLFRRISRLLDPRVGRGMYNTFHARYWPLRWPLDHVFVSDTFVLRRLQRLPAFGSDHFPGLYRVGSCASRERGAGSARAGCRRSCRSPREAGARRRFRGPADPRR